MGGKKIDGGAMMRARREVERVLGIEDNYAFSVCLPAGKQVSESDVEAIGVFTL